ncbi:unnamed protein product [Adineta steineri]|uniref:Uncharacterized protein n=1 Tax=Adineta steineri TaxID=433720 RepID=A0A814G5H2_9BILA|nr:unnamed protein product [Adineta steineri]CAF0994091.1 unnamed protein product [Adineta steineri]
MSGQIDVAAKHLFKAQTHENQIHRVDSDGILLLLYDTLGHIHREKGEYDLALLSYKVSIEIDPTSQRLDDLAFNSTTTATCNFTACNSQRISCSSNLNCDCFSLTSNSNIGICTLATLSCESFVRCNMDNITCSIESTICVNSTRCGQPVCYPLPLANKQICPPKTISTHTTSTTKSTTKSTTTTQKTTTTTKRLTTITTQKPTTTTEAATTQKPTTTIKISTTIPTSTVHFDTTTNQSGTATSK